MNAAMLADERIGPYRPLDAMAVGGALSLFVGAVLSDWAYGNTYEIQWQNFASWLLAGALVFAAIALVLAIVGLFRARRRPSAGAHALVLAIAWIVGLLSALVHARDAWASMPGGLVLSIAATVLTAAAAWLGARTPRTAELRRAGEPR